jgi:ubiquinone/menaquinone biosynthesis C-methylase UbiE
MKIFRKELKKPVELPSSDTQSKEWQKANANWWENNPMRYDWKEGIARDEFSKEFFEEIDHRFFKVSMEFLGQESIPFDSLIDFKNLKDKDVLEVGVGNCSHAQLLAQYAKSFIGIDITDYAVKSGMERFKISNLKGNILKMDAEKLEFQDNSFDFVWSWGVIHHSSNTENVIKEIHRVLRPGGKAIIMVYYRGWWGYYVMETIWGIISGNLLKTKSLHKSVQLHTDGAIARYYSFSEWRTLVGELFTVENIKTLGAKSDVLPLPSGKLKSVISKLLPDNLNRFLTGKLKMGTFLVSTIIKN